MNKGAVLVFVFSVSCFFILSGCSAKPSYNQYTFQWSDGSCMKDSDCTAFDYGCGGGHTECTSNTSKWEGMLSTCEIVENHPSQQGFRCACVQKDQKCGWVK